MQSKSNGTTTGIGMGEHDISALIAWCGTFAENKSHISKTILCQVVIFVNDAACFNYSRSASLAGTRNTVRCATRSRNTAARRGLEVRGALLACGAASYGVATRQ